MKLLFTLILSGAVNAVPTALLHRGNAAPIKRHDDNATLKKAISNIFEEQFGYKNGKLTKGSCSNLFANRAQELYGKFLGQKQIREEEILKLMRESGGKDMELSSEQIALKGTPNQTLRDTYVEMVKNLKNECRQKSPGDFPAASKRSSS